METPPTLEQNESIHTPHPTGDVLSRIARFFIIGLVFVLPLVVSSSTLVPLSILKMTLISLVVVVSFVLWTFTALKKGEFSIPKTPLFLALAALVLVYGISSFFSGSWQQSFLGSGGETGTFVAIISFALLIVLIPTVFRSSVSLVRLYTALFTASILLALFHLSRLFLGSTFLSFGIFTSPLTNTVGSFNDLAIFFAVFVVVSMAALQFLPLRRIGKILVSIGLAVGLFFVALANFSALWIALGVFALVFLVYVLSAPDTRETGKNHEDNTIDYEESAPERKISVVSLVVLILSLIFVFSGGALGRILSSTFGTNTIEARPSFTATFTITQETLSEHPLWGSGPNRFHTQWLLHKPVSVNETAFWNIPFNTGVGFIPSTAVTVGTIGLLAWIAFFVVFLWSGLKVLFGVYTSTIARFLSASSFFAAAFLWTMAIVYTPSAVIFALAFIFTGVSIAAAHTQKRISLLSVRFSRTPAINFVSVLFSVLVVVLLVVGGYAISQRFIAEVYYQRGITQLSQTGNIDAAQASLRSAVRLSAQDRYYRSLAGVSIARIGILLNSPSGSDELVRTQFQELLSRAIESARTAVALDEDNHQNYVSLGQVYESLVPLGIEGAYENAVSAYDEALARNPHGPELYLQRARLEVANADAARAREFIGRALTEKNNYTEAIFLLSQIEIQEGNVAEAIASVEAGTLLAPNDPTVFFQLGLLHYNEENWDAAIRAFENAVALNNLYANAKYFLGLSYEKTGRIADAVAQFEDVQRLNPRNTEVAFILNNVRNARPPFADAPPPLDVEPEDRDALPLEE